MIVKVCGMRNADNIREVENLNIDWMGFIFYPKSLRYVDRLPDYLPEQVVRVGVFVDEKIDVIREKVEMFRLEMVQLHGHETPGFCRQLKQSGVAVIKAFSIAESFPVKNVEAYEHFCDYFLFDTDTAQYGGSGRKFNWNIISDYKGDTPFLLSGGISMDDVEEILGFAHPQFAGIDINSRFEVAPAMKETLLIREFLEKIRNQQEYEQEQ